MTTLLNKAIDRKLAEIADFKQEIRDQVDGLASLLKSTTSRAAQSNFGIIDLVAYAGGIWYFLSQIAIGPWVRTFLAKRLFVAEMG